MILSRLKRILIKLANRYSVFNYSRSSYIKLRSSILQYIYSRKDPDPKLIVFEAYMSTSYACSPRAIYEYMLTNPRYADYRFVWSFTNAEAHSYLQNDRTSIVQFKSRQYYKAYTQAGFWIVNGWIPTLLQKRTGQIMVQCWHGTPLKRLRNDLVKNTKHAKLTYEDQVAENIADTSRYDYFISPSNFATARFTSAFALEELHKEKIVLQAGYPRNDILKNASVDDIAEIRKHLGLPANKKVLLYAPTWRDDQHEVGKGFVYEPPIDFGRLQGALSDDYVLLFRSHYAVARDIDLGRYKGFVYDVTDVEEVSELYLVSDALITDYSSVFFDYANLQRPILYYMHDLEHYKNELRGFYLNVNDLPGRIFHDEADLIKNISSLDDYSKKYAKKLAVFSERFNPLDDGKASRRVVERVFK